MRVCTQRTSINYNNMMNIKKVRFYLFFFSFNKWKKLYIGETPYVTKKVHLTFLLCNRHIPLQFPIYEQPLPHHIQRNVLQEMHWNASDILFLLLTGKTARQQLLVESGGRVCLSLVDPVWPGASWGTLKVVSLFHRQIVATHIPLPSTGKPSQ